MDTHSSYLLLGTGTWWVWSMLELIRLQWVGWVSCAFCSGGSHWDSQVERAVGCLSLHVGVGTIVPHFKITNEWYVLIGD